MYKPNHKPRKKIKCIADHNSGEKIPKTAERIFLEEVRKRRNESRQVKRGASSCIVPVAAGKTKKNQQHLRYHFEERRFKQTCDETSSWRHVRVLVETLTSCSRGRDPSSVFPCLFTHLFSQPEILFASVRPIGNCSAPTLYVRPYRGVNNTALLWCATIFKQPLATLIHV